MDRQNIRGCKAVMRDQDFEPLQVEELNQLLNHQKQMFHIPTNLGLHNLALDNKL